MKYIIWGIVFFLIGAVGWVLSVVLTVATLGKFAPLAGFFGTLAVGSLPVAVTLAGLSRLKKRKVKVE